MALTREQVRHVAQLARLELTEAEEAEYTQKLSAILDAVAQLQSVDTTDVEPTSHANFGEALLRADEVRPSLPHELGLKNAPAKNGTSFAVPKIIE